MCESGPQAGGVTAGGVRELFCCVEEEDWSTGERYSNQWCMRLPQLEQDRETVREVDSSHHQCFSQEWEVRCRRSLPTDGGCHHPGLAGLCDRGVDRKPRRVTLPLGHVATGHPNTRLHWHPNLGNTRDATAMGLKATSFKETHGASLEAYRG